MELRFVFYKYLEVNMTEQIEVIKKETDNMLLWAEGLLVETAEDYKSAFEK